MKLATFSFDDGGEWDIETVRLFNEREVPATFYIPSALLLASVYRGLSPAEIITLYVRHEVGCHGETHRSLVSRFIQDGAHGKTDLSPEREIVRARRMLVDYFGQTQEIKVFSYPYGDHDEDIRWRVKDARFSWARSCKRDKPEEVGAFIERYAAPVTAMIGQRIPEDIADFQPACDCVHIVAHSWEIQVHNQWHQLARLLDSTIKAGYRVVTNSEFFSATYKGNV